MASKWTLGPNQTTQIPFLSAIRNWARYAILRSHFIRVQRNAIHSSWFQLRNPNRKVRPSKPILERASLLKISIIKDRHYHMKINSSGLVQQRGTETQKRDLSELRNQRYPTGIFFFLEMRKRWLWTLQLYIFMQFISLYKKKKNWKKKTQNEQYVFYFGFSSSFLQKKIRVDWIYHGYCWKFESLTRIQSEFNLSYLHWKRHTTPFIKEWKTFKDWVTRQ